MLGKYAAIAAALLFSVVGRAQVTEDGAIPPGLPLASSLFERYVAETGGQAGYDNVQTLLAELSYRRAGEVVMRETMWQTRSGQYRSIAIYDPEGVKTVVETGLNQGIAWQKRGDSAKIFEDGEERNAVLRAAILLSEGQWRSFYKDLKTFDVDTIDGKKCYLVAGNTFDGGSRILAFDQQTGLLAEEVDGNSGIELQYIEYIDAGGVKIPRIAHVYDEDPPLTVNVDRIELNAPTPDSVFALPEDVARLVRKRSQSPGQ